MEVNFDLLLSADTVEKLDAAIQFLEAELAKGNGKAGFILANTYAPAEWNLPAEQKALLESKQDEEKAIHYFKLAFVALTKEAENGNAAAMHMIGQYYQSGIPPVAQDSAQFMVWAQKSFEAGNIFAANELYSHYCNPYSDNYDAEKAAHYFKILEDAHMRCVTRYP